jgi:phage shock protein PspC (stress-responsive transcriptional regulator)
MKKVININFQGRVIPIEEPAYDELRKYIESLRHYFRNEEGRDEIINDIENRIAELFTNRLAKENNNCITEGDLESIIASIGRPEDFEQADNEHRQHETESKSEANPKPLSASEPRGSFYRNSNDTVIAGVCSGVAHYLKIDPTIVRLLFAIITFGGFGSGILIYIVLWIVLPERALNANVKRRLFRNPDSKILGGVCSGLSSYFNIATWIPRLIFLSPILLGFLNKLFWGPAIFFTIPFGGTLFLAYLILWIVLPIATTASEKLEMRGEKVDLASIRDTVREELQDLNTKMSKAGEKLETKAKEWGQEASETAGNWTASITQTSKRNGVGHAIGMMFKIFFLFIASVVAFALLMALMGLLLSASVLLPFQSFILDGWREQASAAGMLILFLGLPIVALVIWLIRRIIGVRSKNKFLGYAFGTLWALGWVSVFAFFSLMGRHFTKRSETEKILSINQPTNGSLDIRLGKYPGRFETIDWFDDEDDAPAVSPNNDSLILNTVRIRVSRSTDSLYRLKIFKAARGESSMEAEETAEKIVFQPLQEDSVIYLPKGFAIAAADKFRNQQVIVVIEVPMGKTIRIDGSTEWFDFFDLKGKKNGLQFNFNYEFNDQFFPFEYDRWYRMNTYGLDRLGLTPEERIEELKEKIEDEFRDLEKDGNKITDSINIRINGKDTIIKMNVDFSQWLNDQPEASAVHPSRT